MATGFLYDPQFLLHDAGDGHPESGDRLRSVMAHLTDLPWFMSIYPVAARPADAASLLTVHTAEYLERAEAACGARAAFLDTQDVGISAESFRIARLAAGGSLALADEVMAGRIQNGFGLVRPPGHHALPGTAMGFCILNNVALTARHLQKKHGLKRIAIVDWDVHHGNGTQDIFYEDPAVLYVSLHQYPFYPGTGADHETGLGAGKGTTLNCPMEEESNDFDYQETFASKVLPKLEEFRPEAVLISAGFDAHAKDPLGNIRLTADCFGWMTLRLMEVAEKYAGGKIISLLEGGYDLQALPLCVEKHVAALAGRHDRSFQALG